MRNRAPALLPLLALSLVGVQLASCDRPATTNELLLVGQAGPLLEVLEACAGTSESEVSRQCRRMADAIAPCQAVTARCEIADGQGSCDLAAQVQCVVEGEPGAFSDLGSEGAAWRFRGPLAGASQGVLEALGFDRKTAKASNEPGIVEQTEIVVAIEDAPDTWQRLLPAEGSAGRFQLSSSNSFLHLRLRPEGGLVPQETQEESIADRLYGLRAELFTAAVLTGNVEFVLHVPESEDLFPGSAAALDFKVKSAAVAAMEQYIKQLQQQWPLTRVDYRNSRGEGACLGNLRVMPGLAPCYIATSESIVVGWNQKALEMALQLGDNEPTAAKQSAHSRALLDFDQLGLADRRLAESRERKVAFHYPYDSMEVQGSKEDERVVLKVTLRGDPTSQSLAGAASSSDRVVVESAEAGTESSDPASTPGEAKL